MGDFSLSTGEQKSFPVANYLDSNGQGNILINLFSGTQTVGLIIRLDGPNGVVKQIGYNSSPGEIHIYLYFGFSIDERNVATSILFANESPGQNIIQIINRPSPPGLFYILEPGEKTVLDCSLDPSSVLCRNDIQSIVTGVADIVALADFNYSLTIALHNQSHETSWTYNNPFKISFSMFYYITTDRYNLINTATKLILISNERIQFSPQPPQLSLEAPLILEEPEPRRINLFPLFIIVVIILIVFIIFYHNYRMRYKFICGIPVSHQQYL